MGVQQQNDQNDAEKRKKLLAQQRQKRIEDMISQNPNIYDLEEMQRKKKEEMQRKKKEKEREEHRRKTEKLLSLKNKKKNKAKNSTVSLSALNDIADQWASEKPLRSPSITPSHKSNDNYFDAQHQQQSQSQSIDYNHQNHHHHNNNHANNGHIPQPQLNPPTSKLQQWVSLAKQPKFNSMANASSKQQSQSNDHMMEKEKELKFKQAQQQKLRQQQQQKQRVKMKTKPKTMSNVKQPQKIKNAMNSNHKMLQPQQPTTWEELKESIVCGDRIFAEIPCSPKCSPYILVSTSSILQEWSDRLEDFHRWCTQYGLCRFLPISQCVNRDHPSEASNRAVILEFSFVTKAKIARERLMVKLGRRDIEFVQWRFGHAYFFKHSYVKLNEEIIMTGKEFKRLDQIFKSERKTQKQRKQAPPMHAQQAQLMRPWEAYPSLALPADYNNVSMSELSESSYSQYESSYISSSEYEEDDDDDYEDEDEVNEGEHRQQQQQHHQDGNKIIYNSRILYIGDIVYMSLYPHVPFIIHKNIGNGFVEILKPDNSKECVEISRLQNALSFPSLHQDTKDENELRFRQSLLEDLSECQLDYLLVCME